MPTKFTAVVALTSLAVGLLGGSAFTHAARADYSASPNGSCATSTPCLTESNASSGPGVKSTSNRGNGLLATTKALGSTSTNGGGALVGQDLQANSGDGLFNFGVNGTSVNGTGVQGTGGAVGVSAAATGATGTGVSVTTPYPDGLLFKGFANGLTVFTMDATGHAKFGNPTVGYEAGSVTVNQRCGNGTPMFEGDNQNGEQFRVGDCGDVFTPDTIGTTGTVLASHITAYNGAPVNVDEALNANNLFTSVDPYGYGTNYTATDSSGVTWLYQGYSTTSGKYTVEMGDSGSIYARIFITMLSPRVAQKTTNGSRVDTYTPQVTQPTLEDFGEAQLSGGVANVALDAKFIAAIDDTTRYIVTLTPEGDCRGLYVSQRTQAGFTVRELQGGRSSIGFSYRIVAKPLGDDAARLPSSLLPYGFANKVPPPVILHKPGRPAIVRPPRPR